MKQFFTFLVLVSIASLANSQKVINDANVELRTVGSFTGIVISSGIDLYLSSGDEAVAVSANKPEQRDQIRTEVKDGILKIWYEDKAGIDIKIYGGRRLRAYVSYKTLKSLQASGGSDVLVDGAIRSGDFTLVLSGGSDFKGAVEASTLTVQQSGGSDVDISGKATILVVNASGGSDFDGYGLAADNCNIDVQGGSDVQMTANKELIVKASGASDVTYRGNPSVKKLKTSGASSVKSKG